MITPEFVNNLIGRPYKPGATGPDAFDCYGLTRLVQSVGWGRDLPDIVVPEIDDRRIFIALFRQHAGDHRWRQVERFGHGTIVTMARHDNALHVGTYLDFDGGGVLHALERPGVQFDPLPCLKATGWRRFRFYEPVT